MKTNLVLEQRLGYVEKEADKIIIKLSHHKIAQVEEFFYLGSKITSDGRSKNDTVSRRAQGKKAFHQKRTLLTAKNTRLAVRKPFIKTYTWSMPLNGSEV
jgi:hypothetical protein